MRVKVGDTWHDGEKEPVMVELTAKDKENIANMAPDATKYCSYPDRLKPEEVEAWMAEEKPRICTCSDEVQFDCDYCRGLT
jgi:hypothetical protein